ncbi:glycoside hydrolase family protein [Bacillus norwichensis]|uniref:Poly(Glycerol-phosphate) alpha-glucosyltransferase n=1 Tax=Bacillus norwichensis TaxID=2762217 RepID=A0ABR8VS68_9BACI|nr:hypothetical protein [Bacillus norwichensis]MBD8007628.1 hypothetical protein [Bacillus norwichensis]
MEKLTAYSYVNQTLDEFEIHFNKMFGHDSIPAVSIAGEQRYIIFLSIGNPKLRARVFKEGASDITKVFQGIRKKVTTFIQKSNFDPQWLKLDIVKDLTELPFKQLEDKIAKTRINYFRHGISFDPEFRLAFLEQEINGNAMIKSTKNGPIALDEKNINNYMKYNLHVRFPFVKTKYDDKNVFLFNTVGAFKDSDSDVIHNLYDGTLTNGIRKTENIRDEVKALIHKATYFLTDQIQPDGKFEYGYFSAYAKRINTYNILRHSSALYSMAEGYEIIQDPAIIKAAEKGLDYLVKEAVIYKKDLLEVTAFVVDQANNNEIKLGSNATAILAMTKYMEVTGSSKYIEAARALARGIIHMKLPDGGFIHVLSYPTFAVKDLHRIIYYEGEAVFSLLRLYAIDPDNQWLEEAKKSFEYFIRNDYWKHHDHWLSYAANELTNYEPKDKYFIFGLKNCNNRLNFIFHRETTYPTFLELTMAAYKMVSKIKELNKESLLEHIDEGFLEDTIDRRAEYQRVGFFYPELAMYKKLPDLILNGFFIRHHSFRVRIDDVEHYLSGYCQFLQHRASHLNTYKVEIEESIVPS